MLNNIANKMLFTDFLLNVDMLECIRRGSAEILWASDEAVLLIDVPSQIYMLSANNTEITKILINKLPNNLSLIVAHDKFSFDLLREKFNFNETMICYNTVYIKKTPINIMNSMIQIKRLTLEHKSIITKNYSKIDMLDTNYIENRLKANVMFGAFIDNNLCGFIGNHEEGSIGMLEVFPDYMGKGIGSALQIAATNDALVNKRYPYGQVVETNQASIALQKKLDFKFSKNKVYWLIK